jgi:hypothetical protein
MAAENEKGTEGLRPGSGARSHASNTGPGKSIAGLSFLDLSDKRDQGYFAEEISEEIINLLAKVREWEDRRAALRISPQKCLGARERSCNT